MIPWAPFIGSKERLNYYTTDVDELFNNWDALMMRLEKGNGKRAADRCRNRERPRSSLIPTYTGIPSQRPLQNGIF